MNNHFARATLLGGSTFLVLAANTAFAETKIDEIESDRVENVLVVGTRQAYQGEFTTLETPQAEITLDAAVLRNAGVTNLVQALDLSASVARQNNFGGLWNSFAIRGFVGDLDLPSNYLVNGFNAGRGFGGPRDLSGVEAVEVLKGPRSALFGRGEPGGTVNLVTKRPTFEKEGEIRLSAGSFDTYRTDVDYTTPLSENVAVRFVAFYEDAKSFRDTIETKKQGLSPSIVFKINENSQLVYELEYSDQEIPFDRGVIAVGLQGEPKVLGLIPESRFLGEPGDGPIETEVVGHQIEFQHTFNENWSALVGFNYRDTSLEGLATENQFYGSPTFSRQFLEFDGENLSRFRRYRDYDATYHVFRAEISGSFETSGIEHRLIFGLDADEFENDQFVLRARGGNVIGSTLTSVTAQDNFVINIFNPVYDAFVFPTLDPVANANTDKTETQESIGLYIQDQISITENLDIRLGARFDDYEQELDNRGNSTVSEYSKSQVSPQFGVVYQASDSLSFYAVYGENFRPLTGSTDESNLDPNESESTEIGLKFTTNNGALVGNIAIFDVKQSNITTSGTGISQIGVGRAESQGVELDLQGNLTETISMLFSYAFIDAETKDTFNDPGGFGSVDAGAELLNIPEQQLSVQLEHQAREDLSFIGGLVYVSDRNGFFSDQSFRLPSYTTVQIAANFQVTDFFELRGEIDNLLDREHYTNSFADVWVQPGTPRTVSLSATFRF